MGINYDCVFVFGVVYSFGDLDNFRCHKDTRKLADNIGCDYLINLWEESEPSILPPRIEFIASKPYFDADEEDCEYFIGYKLSSELTPQEMKYILTMENDIQYKINQICKNFNLLEQKVRFLVTSNIW